MTNPNKCRCGASARVRDKNGQWWVECRNKCGMRTGYYTSIYDDVVARERAVSDWNRMVWKNGEQRK